MDFGDGKMAEDESQSREDEQKVTKQLQAVMLLKKKMTKTDMLIRQFNDKTMECNALKEELATVRSDKQDLLNKYNVNLEKMTRLELTNAEYEESIKNHQAIVNKQHDKLEENDKHINQLKYKIKDLEDVLNVLQSEIKSTKTKVKTEKKSNGQGKEQAIQTDLKVCDSSMNTDPIDIIQEKLETKDPNTMTNSVKHVFKQPDVRDEAIMTESTEPIFKKPQMKHQKLMTESTKSISKRIETKNKGIVTDECINAKNEPFPFYCSKCEILIQPAPVKQILRVMTAPPPLLSEYLSPPHSPTLPKSNIEDYREENPVMSIGHNDDNNVTLFSFNDTKYENETPITNEKPCSSFMEIDKLSRKISKLEKLVKKKILKNHKNSCCHNNCGSLKNVKFIVQLPNEKKFFEYRKREKRKIKRLENLTNKGINKRIKSKKKGNSERRDGDWKVENCSKPKKRKIMPEKKMNSNKKTKLTNQQCEELFEYSEISDCDERSSIITSPPILGTNQPQPKSINMESVPLPDRRTEMNTDISKKLIDEDTLNLTELIRKDEVSSDSFIPSESTEKNEEPMQLPTAQLDSTTNVIVVNEQIDILTEFPNNEIINCTDHEPIDNKLKKNVLNEKADKSINILCDKLYDATEEKSNKPKLPIDKKFEENHYEHVRRSPAITESSEEYALSVTETSIAAEKSPHFSIPDEVDQKNSSKGEGNEQNEEFDSIDQITSFPNSDNILCKLVKENHNQVSEVKNENETLISVKEYTGDSSENILSFENTESFKKCDLLTSESDNDEKINFNISNANLTINESLSKKEINRQIERIENSDETTSLANDNYENTAHESTNESHCPSSNENLKEGAKKYLISCEESLNNSENVKNSDVCGISSSGREINTNIKLDFNVIDNNEIIDGNVSTKERNLQNGECENIVKVDALDIDQSLINESSSTEQLAVPEVKKSFMHEDIKKRFGGLSSIQQFSVSKVERDLTHKNIEKLNEEENQQINSELVENNLQRMFELPEVIEDSATHKNEQSSLCVTSDEKEIMEDIFVEENNSNVTNIETETAKENVSLGESSESQFLISPEKKSNNVNIIRSDESDEKSTVEPNVTKRIRSGKVVKTDKIVIPRKKFLAKIRNIKKISAKPITVSQSKPCRSQSIPKSLEVPIETVTATNDLTCISDTSIDSASSCLLVKKQRIAHTPKSICTNTEIIDKEQKKVPKIIKKTKLNSKSTHKSEAKESGDKISSILEVFDKTCKERAEIYRNLNVSKSVQEDSASLRNLISNDVQMPKMAFKECTLSNKLYTDSPMEETISNDHNVNSGLLANIATEDENELNSLKEQDKTVQNSSISNKTKLEKKTVNIGDEVTSPIRALRSRQVVINEKTFKAKKLKTKKLNSSSQDLPVLINETNCSLKNTTIVSFLNEYISKHEHSHYLRDEVHIMNARKNEKFIQKQLDLLMATEEWTMDINTQVVENLINTQELRTLAIFVIDFTADNIVNNEELDKTHTPPAPMMVRSEQKIVTLILSINKKHPEFMDIVIEGIQYKLFRLGGPQPVQIVERLFRILVVLSKIKKDREKVRIFCCDALYCLNLRAVNIIYVALTCWPEILPKHDSNNDVIVKTIVHIVMTLQVGKPYIKLNSLRKLLSTYYEYPDSGYMTNIFKVELFKNLQENAPGINTAILLLCKKMGPEWAAENIVRSLKQMIVTQMHPSLYEVLNLLGNVLRSFPANDPNNAVDEIIDQLCDVLDGNAGEYNLQEGIVSCLLSISKFKFEQVALSVIKWQSNNDLRPTTKDKLKSFFRQHDGKWWETFVKSNFPLLK